MLLDSRVRVWYLESMGIYVDDRRMQFSGISAKAKFSGQRYTGTTDRSHWGLVLVRCVLATCQDVGRVMTYKALG